MTFTFGEDGPIVPTSPTGEFGPTTTRVRLTSIEGEVHTDGYSAVRVMGRRVNRDGSDPKRTTWTEPVYNDEVRAWAEALVASHMEATP